MPKNPLVTAETYRITKLFQRGEFTVPWYQRYYDWEEDEVRSLLEDIDDAIAKNYPCYFLGSVILINKSVGYYEINDGQQRFVTLSLICAHLCQTFNYLGDDEREKQTMNFLFDLGPDNAAKIGDAGNLTPRIGQAGYTRMLG